MAKGITYTVTDSTGLVHTRYSAGHTEPRYKFAVVAIPGCPDKDLVSYTSRRELALGNETFRCMYKGERMYPDAEVQPVEWRAGR